MLSALNLTCERDERLLLNRLSLRVQPGEWVQITGANGCGKTTLLRMLVGLGQPDAGQVCWCGEPLARVREHYHQSLLWIGHQVGLKTTLTALENLHFLHPAASQESLCQALAQVALAGAEALPVCQLSAGQQRRVALARLWLSLAPMWILDEPFTALDVDGIARLTQRMALHVQRQGSIILTTHQPLMTDIPLRQIDLNRMESAA